MSQYDNQRTKQMTVMRMRTTRCRDRDLRPNRLPMHELKLPKTFERDLRAKWVLLDLLAAGQSHPIHSHSERNADWDVQNADLARRASDGDDEALFKLLRRDARYFETTFVRAKISSWKLDVVLGRQIQADRRHPNRMEEKTKIAIARLKEIAATVKWTGGQGNRSWIPSRNLVKQYERAIVDASRVQQLIASTRHSGAIPLAMVTRTANAIEIEPERLKKIVEKAGRKGLRTIALEIVEARLSRGVNRLRVRVREAMRLRYEGDLDEHEN